MGPSTRMTDGLTVGYNVDIQRCPQDECGRHGGYVRAEAATSALFVLGGTLALPFPILPGHPMRTGPFADTIKECGEFQEEPSYRRERREDNVGTLLQAGFS